MSLTIQLSHRHTAASAKIVSTMERENGSGAKMTRPRLDFGERAIEADDTVGRDLQVCDNSGEMKQTATHEDCRIGVIKKSDRRLEMVSNDRIRRCGQRDHVAAYRQQNGL